MTIDQGTRQFMDPGTDQETRVGILRKLGHSRQAFDADPLGINMKHDSLNQKRIYQIPDEHGYYGKSLADTPTNMSGRLVIQHSDAINKYLPLIKEAGKNG